MEKKTLIKGIVKAVQSGDHVIISKSVKSGPAKEYPVFLASVQAPKIGSTNRVEEPFGFEAREFLREKIIGKKCEFKPEYTFGGREYGTLTVGEENLNLAIIKAGLAKVLEKRGNMQGAANYEELKTAGDAIKAKGTMVWSTDASYLEKHTRNVTYFLDQNFSGAKYFEESKSIDKPLEAIVEYVFSPSFVTVYVHKFQAVFRLAMTHLFTPSTTDKAIQAEGKAFTEKLLLHRTIGVKFDKVEEGGIFNGRIFHPAGDIAYEVVKNGYSKINVPKNTDFDAEYYKTLKEAQLVAQSKGIRIWKDFKQEEKKQQKPSVTDFNGKVVEIHSGDSLTVQRENDLANFRVFLTTVKAPVMLNKESQEPEPYAWESKEALRKATIGKKVKVVMEYSRTVPGKAGEKDRNMDFATIFLQKNNKNVATLLLEKGLLKTNVSKSGDNASKFLEDLLGAEKKAQDARLGLHSSAQAPIRAYNDLTHNAKKSKDFEAIVMKRPNRKLQGIVEYCFSGMRYKIRLDSENTAVGFSLFGVKTMVNDKNQPQLLEFANDAQSFAKETLFQRDVTVEPEFTDKQGNFFGTLWHNKSDFAVELVQEGLAQVSVFGGKIPHNIDELRAAEAKAKTEGLGIWAKGLKLAAGQSPKKVKQMERIQVEMTDIKDATRFHMRILGESQYSKIDNELDRFNPQSAEDLEKPIKKGTLCAARFSVDNKWYRASVLRSVGKGQLEVEFVDFGNIETVDANDLKRLPASLMQYEPQAKLCNLAYIKVPPVEKDFGREAGKLVQKMALEKISEAVVVEQYGNTLQIILFEKGEKDWNNSVNAILIAEGLAAMRHLDEDDQTIPEEVNEWYDFEEEAREKQLKIWEYGGAGGDSDEN